MDKEKLIVESTRLALANLQLSGLDPQEVIICSIRYLMESCTAWRKGREDLQNAEADLPKEAAMLKKAVLFIQVYIELGFSYESHAELFEQVFEAAGLTEDEVLSFKRRFAQKLKLNRTKIDSVLGRWNPKYHSNTKKEVINDIMEKIKNKEQGEYFYYSKQKYSEQKDVYQLVVEQDGSYFCHVNKQKYYEFENTR
ncbi:MAG: hypothetical protein HFH15_07025 [Ruminococcus sp.]|jgi:predicted  nucleic acid-binding Zn-ribbon protein|nr:hypothetical protein [Ruminococcus sp.]